MLFGYLNAPEHRFHDDVQSSEASRECFAFDRPLILKSEVHVAGAMAFAATFGFGGLSLIEWALLQTFESVCHDADRAAALEAEMMSEFETKRESELDLEMDFERLTPAFSPSSNQSGK